MDIKSFQTMNAYTANALFADTASVQNSPKETPDVEPNAGRPQTVQEAFQVNITQQALALQTENTADLSQKTRNSSQLNKSSSPNSLRSHSRPAGLI